MKVLAIRMFYGVVLISALFVHMANDEVYAFLDSYWWGILPAVALTMALSWPAIIILCQGIEKHVPEED